MRVGGFTPGAVLVLRCTQALLQPRLHCTVFELPVVVPETEVHMRRLVAAEINGDECAKGAGSPRTSSSSSSSTCGDVDDDAELEEEEAEEEAVLGGRVRAVGGTIWAPPEEWPRPSGSDSAFDAVLFSNIFHDWSAPLCHLLSGFFEFFDRSNGISLQIETLI